MYKYDELAIEKALKEVSIEGVFQDELPEYLYTVNDFLCFGFPKESAENVLDYMFECLGILEYEITEEDDHDYYNTVLINAYHSICAVALEIIKEYKEYISYYKESNVEQLMNISW